MYSKHHFIPHYNRIQNFVHHVLTPERFNLQDYINGSERIEFYPERLERTERLLIADHTKENDPRLPTSYEEALYSRLTYPDSTGILVLIGGLGSGKSTVTKYIQSLFLNRRDQISRRYICKCQPCRRSPVRVDCLDIERVTPFDNATVEIFRRIRLSIYQMLIDEWLLRQNIDPAEIVHFDVGYRVLRRLMIANDIGTWSDSERRGTYPLALHRSSCRLPSPLLSMTLTKEDVLGLIQKFDTTVDEMEAQLSTAVHEVHTSLDFTAIVLGFHLSHCSAANPQNLLIVDNLDQLPTEFIEQLVGRLHSISTKASGARILVPLRPSSLALNGFISDVQYMYHYGPNCFQMMLHRIKKYVLDKNREELRSSIMSLEGVGSDTKEISNEELDIFLIATYLYAMVLHGGLSPIRRRLEEGEIDRPSFEGEHQFLHNLSFTPTGLRSASDTLGALVGTCARYGIGQARRYYYKVYNDPVILNTAISRGLHMGATVRVPIPYNLLISTILGDWSEPANETRLVNLYRPTINTANPDMPSLIKLRILSLLRTGERVPAKSVIGSLAAHGIPADRALDALNNLHDKSRLLLWFSRNSDLTVSPSDLDQHIVISEHGIRYLLHVMGDFEYIWFCARQIPPTIVSLKDHNFTSRLGEYRRLLQALGDTEWKQLAFNRCSARVGSQVSDRPIAQNFFILLILYSSLARGLGSAKMSPSRAQQRPQYRDELGGLVKEICELILHWQSRYRICFGGTGFLNQFDREIKYILPSMKALKDLPFTSDETKIVLEETISSLTSSPVQEELEWLRNDLSTPGRDDFTARIIETGRGAFESIKDWKNILDRYEAARTFLWHFFRERRALAEYLEKRLPSYSEVERRVSFLKERATEVREVMREHSSSEAGRLDWFVGEAEWLRDKHVRLIENKFDVQSIVYSDEMDEKKDATNNIMSIFRGMAQYLGAREISHLDVFWR